MVKMLINVAIIWGHPVCEYSAMHMCGLAALEILFLYSQCQGQRDDTGWEKSHQVCENEQLSPSVSTHTLEDSYLHKYNH